MPAANLSSEAASSCGNEARIGTVSYDAETGIGRVFSGALSKRVLTEGWTANHQPGRNHCCTHGPCPVGPHLANRREVLWVENEAIRNGLIKGRSSSPSMVLLIRLFASTKDGSYTWKSRIPSLSNLTDGQQSPLQGQSALKLLRCLMKTRRYSPDYL